MAPSPTRIAGEISPDPPGGWDAFVDSSLAPHFEQLAAWRLAEVTDGWKPAFAVQRDGDGIAAGGLILHRQHGRAGRVGYLLRGPLLRRGEEAAELANDRACELVAHAVRRLRLRFLVVAPAYSGETFVRRALRAGFLFHPPELPPRGMSKATIAVDLRAGPKAVEASFRRSTRQEINRGRKEGVTVRQGDTADLDRFWREHLELCRRRGVSSNIPSRSFLDAAWTGMAGEKRARLFLAQAGDREAGALICFVAGRTCFAWRIGWNGQHAAIHPTKVLYAEAIRQAAEEGCEAFDFLQIDPVTIGQLNRGEKPTDPDAGMTIFKLGFAGTVKPIPPTLVWFRHGLMRLAMRYGGLRLLSRFYGR